MEPKFLRSNHNFVLARDLHELKTMVRVTTFSAQNKFRASQIAMKRFALGTVFLLCNVGPITSSAALSCKNVFQRESKEQYLVETFTKGSPDFILAQDFAKKIQSLPEPAQKKWRKAIGAAYRSVPKKDPSIFAKWHIGGRRLLDRTLTLLERYDQKFEKDLTEGLTPRQAYAAFLSRQKEIFKTDYSEVEISQIVDFLKKELAQLQLNRKGPDIKLMLAGSFINGKAHLKNSDIDMSMTDPRLVSEVPRWQEKINQIFATSKTPTELTIEAHTEPEFFYGKLNPIVIRISARQVEIIVFPPAISSYQQAELLSAKPKIYLMDYN